MNSSKKAYKSPSLILYGPLRELTKGGSGAKIEGVKAEVDKRP